MSTATIPATATADAPHSDRPRFPDLVAAEWIKIRGQRSLSALAAFCLVWAAVGAWLSAGGVHIAPGAASFFNPLIYPFNDTTWSLLAVLAATFGALSIAGDYSSGLIRTTFTAVTTRGRVMAAKTLVVALSTTAIGLACALLSLPIAGSELAGQLTGLGLTGPGVAQAIIASTLLMTIAALIGMTIGALMRHSAAAVATTWTALLFLPQLLGSGSINLPAAVEAMPVQLWTAIAHTQVPSPHPAPLASTPVAWALEALWPAFAVAATVWIVRRRDV